MLQKKLRSTRFAHGASPLHTVPLHRVSRYCEQLASFCRPYALQFVHGRHTPSLLGPLLRSVLFPGLHCVYGTHAVSEFSWHCFWYVPNGQARLWHTTQAALRVVFPGHWLGGRYRPETQLPGAVQFRHVTLSW
jgi:hypothetical protein